MLANLTSEEFEKVTELTVGVKRHLRCFKRCISPKIFVIIGDRDGVIISTKPHCRESIHPYAGALGCFKGVWRQRAEGTLKQPIWTPIQHSLSTINVLQAIFRTLL